MKECIKKVLLFALLIIFLTAAVCFSEDLAALIAQLKDKDPTKRAAAAKAIGDSGDKTAVDALITALKAENESEEENDMVEKFIVKSLGKLKDPKAVDILITVATGEAEEGEEELDEDEEDYVSEAAIEALGEIGDKKAVEPLKKLLGSSDAGIVKATKKALEKLE